MSLWVRTSNCTNCFNHKLWHLYLKKTHYSSRSIWSAYQSKHLYKLLFIVLTEEKMHIQKWKKIINVKLSDFESMQNWRLYTCLKFCICNNISVWHAKVTKIISKYTETISTYGTIHKSHDWITHCWDIRGLRLSLVSHMLFQFWQVSWATSSTQNPIYT